jgi:hypothetical protein
VTTRTWRVEEWLGDTRSSRIARAVRLADDERVLLKIAHDGADAAVVRREHELMLAIDVPGVPQPGPLLQGPEGLAAALGPAGPMPLVGRLGAGAWEWRLATRLVLVLARTLAALHARGLVHRDLRPGNLLLDAPAEALRIADFSAAAPPGPASPHEGLADGSRADLSEPGDPWAYLSPEHTGRAGRPVDARSDLYVLGLLMYRLLAGRLPFDARDPLEWAHCHLARVPPSLADAVPALPQILAEIVSCPANR